MLMLKSLSVLIVAASAAHALQSPACVASYRAASNLRERGLADGTTGIIDNLPGLLGLPGLGGLGDLLGGGGKTTTGKVKRELDDFVPVPNSAIPVESLPGTDSALNDVTSDHNVLPQDAGLESLISGLHKRQDEDDVDSNSGLDAGAEIDADFDLVRRGYRKASGVKSRVIEPKPATFVKKSKKHPKTADEKHRKKHNEVHKKPDEEHKKHDEEPKKHDEEPKKHHQEPKKHHQEPKKHHPVA